MTLATMRRFQYTGSVIWPSDIYVGNLSFDETDEALEAAFANHGKVQSARVWNGV